MPSDREENEMCQNTGLWCTNTIGKVFIVIVTFTRKFKVLFSQRIIYDYKNIKIQFKC